MNALYCNSDQTLFLLIKMKRHISDERSSMGGHEKQQESIRRDEEGWYIVQVAKHVLLPMTVGLFIILRRRSLLSQDRF